MITFLQILFAVALFSGMASISETPFPKTLKDFGYTFNKDGQLRKIGPDGEPGSEPFEFNVSEDPDYNQEHYEALGDVLTEYVFELLEKEVGLEKLMIPKDAPPSESAVIFATPDIHSKPEKLLLLIPGSGAVKAGQWARSLIINDCLDSGTQIPFIKKAKESGYAVLVLNPNDNTKVIDGNTVKIKGSENSKKHLQYVWKNYVKEVSTKHIAIVAHSFGGFTTLELAAENFSDFTSKVFAIALTDSVHNIRLQKPPKKVLQYLKKVSQNWVAHDTPLDTPVPGNKDDIPRVSADKPSGCPCMVEPVNESNEFVAMMKSRLNEHFLIYGAEIDGIKSEEVVTNLQGVNIVELKVNRQFTADNQWENFKRAHQA